MFEHDDAPRFVVTDVTAAPAVAHAVRGREEREPRAKRMSWRFPNSAHGVCHATGGSPASCVRARVVAQQRPRRRRTVRHEARPHRPVTAAKWCASRVRRHLRGSAASRTVVARSSSEWAMRRTGSRTRPARGPHRAPASRERRSDRARCRRGFRLVKVGRRGRRIATQVETNERSLTGTEPDEAARADRLLECRRKVADAIAQSVVSEA